MGDRSTISQSLYFASRRGVSTIPEGDTKNEIESKIDNLVKRRRRVFSVIPAEAGIQSF